MEHYYAESPYDHKRTISLNLADLKSENAENRHNPNVRTIPLSPELAASIRDPDEFLRRSISDISQQESSYRQNLSILLSKSQGTKYEATLRKIMNMEPVDVIYSPQKSTEVPESSKKPISIDNPHPAVPRRSVYQQQDALKDLAKPLSRKMWQVNNPTMLTASSIHTFNMWSCFRV